MVLSFENLTLQNLTGISFQKLAKLQTLTMQGATVFGVPLSSTQLKRVDLSFTGISGTISSWVVDSGCAAWIRAVPDASVRSIDLSGTQLMGVVPKYLCRGWKSNNVASVILSNTSTTSPFTDRGCCGLFAANFSMQPASLTVYRVAEQGRIIDKELEERDAASLTGEFSFLSTGGLGQEERVPRAFLIFEVSLQKPLTLIKLRKCARALLIAVVGIQTMS